MDKTIIDNVSLTDLKIIEHPKGDIFHALKKSEDSYKGFGEVYFSNINHNEIKGWKKHTKMTLNIVVPVGKIKFVIFDDRKESKTYNQFFEVILSTKNYKRLTIAPNLWVAFKGLEENNFLLNIADLEHNPTEGVNINLNEITYNWNN